MGTLRGCRREIPESGFRGTVTSTSSDWPGSSRAWNHLDSRYGFKGSIDDGDARYSVSKVL